MTGIQYQPHHYEDLYNHRVEVNESTRREASELVAAIQGKDGVLAVQATKMFCQADTADEISSLIGEMKQFLGI